MGGVEARRGGRGGGVDRYCGSLWGHVGVSSVLVQVSGEVGRLVRLERIFFRGVFRQR